MASTPLKTLLPLLALLSPMLAVPARGLAQVSVTAMVESDYRFRGVSLTDGKPDLKLAIAYDHASGAYAGASVVIGKNDGDRRVEALGYAGYLGFAKRSGVGLTWDLGATTSRLVDSVPSTVIVRPATGPAYTISSIRHYIAAYNEVYAGVSKGAVSVYAHLSPDYIGVNRGTAYFDLNWTTRPRDHLRLFWHAGLLTPLGVSGDRSLRYDLRTGVAVEFSRGEVQLAWTKVGPRMDYPFGRRQSPEALVVSAAGFF
ncbi:MAG TPA: TorF family putative porin [Caulobacteraceae bacterium]|nr:TorF family putative porin [Caulobacteraceae bacterium]